MIDTAAKRRSAIATRRLPWFRRFAIPLPDGTIDQADRQTLAFVYGGIPAAGTRDDLAGPRLCAGKAYLQGVRFGRSFIPGIRRGKAVT